MSGGLGLGLASSVALGGAVFLAYHDRAGWGWLIFAAILIAGAASDFAKH